MLPAASETARVHLRTMVQRNTWQRDRVRTALGDAAGFVSAQDLHAALRTDNTGIGLAMAQHFAQSGMKVMIADIQSGALDDAVDALRGDGLDAAGCLTDVTKPESLEHLAHATVERIGGVHLLCNNAGIGPGGQTMLWQY